MRGPGQEAEGRTRVRPGQVVGRLRTAVIEAAGDARRSWNLRAWIALLAVAVAAAAPLVVSSPVRLSAMAAGMFVALAAVGLNFAIGLAGMPSLGQGGFAAIGAFGVALLMGRAGWGPLPAAITATAVAAAAGIVVGAGAIRLRGGFVAVSTWLFSWLVALLLGAIPAISGGSQGVAVPSAKLTVPLTGAAFRLTPGAYYEVGLALLGLALLAYLALSRGPVGLSLASLRQSSAAALALGVEGRAAQVGLFAVSAAMAGVAGALLVQVRGVADPAAYGPLLSVELFLAVLLGGEGTVVGPLLGATALVLIPRASRAIGSIAGRGPERYEPVLASVLLLVALLFLGRGGIWRSTVALARRVRGGEIASERPPTGVRTAAVRPPPPTEHRAAPENGETALRARDLGKHFDGIVALDGFSLSLAPATVSALIGPNGSGKTTCLRVLGGTLRPDRGSLMLDGRDVTAMPTPERVRAGIVRTLQQTRVFPELTALQHVLAGTVARRSFGGTWRTLLCTPLARREQAEERERARDALGLVGLLEVAATPVSLLSQGEQRLLILATAIVSNPRVLLLDEPSAGMSSHESGRLAEILDDLRGRGVALLLVEHNLRLVRSVAERVTVLDAGRVIAEGSPGEIGSDPVVQKVYLGSSRM